MQSKETVLNIQVSDIIPDPENLREHFDEADLDALGQNMVEHGQMDPIQIFKSDNGSYDLYDGERRWRAAPRVGITELKALIINRPSKEDLLCKKVSRALQTRNLTAQEEVAALETALESLGIRDNPSSWTAAARRLGIPPELLRSRMKISQLDISVREEFDKGELSVSAAEALGRLDSKTRQTEVSKFIKTNQLSTRFVGTKFIKHLAKNPDAPIMDVYAVALAEEREPNSVSHNKLNEKTPEGHIQDMLADLRRSERWLETAGRENLLSLLEQNGKVFERNSLITTVKRLSSMCQSFMKFTTEDSHLDKDKQLAEGD